MNSKIKRYKFDKYLSLSKNKVIKKHRYNENQKIIKTQKYKGLFILIILIFVSFLTLIECNNNEIILKMNGQGNNTFINSTFITDIEKLILNGIESDNITDNVIYCNNETNIVKIIFKKSLTTCNQMFNELKNKVEIDLSNFDFSSTINMDSMFNGCSNLIKLNFTGVNTIKVTTMNSLFQGCSSLENLDLSSLRTNNVTSMKNMFYNCLKLKSINIENFDTSKVKSMQRMFDNCTSLESLDLSNFRTPEVTDISYMFQLATNLKSLDLSNFNTSKITSIKHLFCNCKALESLNFATFISCLQ